MTTQADRFLAIQYATLGFPGIHYNAGGMRCHPDQPPHEEDCSGLQSYAYEHIVGPTPGNACMTAASLAAWCRASHTTVDRASAIAHGGTWCFLGPIGGEHHVAVSTGDGRVFAARGHFETPQIGFTRFDVDPWGSYGWPPALNHDAPVNPLPGPTGPGEAAAMGYVAGTVVPGARPQQHPKEWHDRAPFVACQQDQKTGHWKMVGLNGAELLNRGYQNSPPVNGFGVSVVDLGPLNAPIFDADTPTTGPLAGKIVFLADDGGTFVPIVQVHYPTTG